MDRFFVEEIKDASGAVVSFGVMDREHPDDIVADFPDRVGAETEAGLCNQCPDDYDVERRFCLGEELA
jgi:hypothetical protein